MNFWKDNPDAVEFIKDEIVKGTSLGQIAVELSRKYNRDISRNAVIGLKNRKGILVRELSGKPPGAKGPKEFQKNASRKSSLGMVRAPTLYRDNSNFNKSEGEQNYTCTIQELTSETCRWPLGPMLQRPPFDYCGAPPVENCPYCLDHWHRALDAARMRRYNERRRV